MNYNLAKVHGIYHKHATLDLVYKAQISPLDLERPIYQCSCGLYLAKTYVMTIPACRSLVDMVERFPDRRASAIKHLRYLLRNLDLIKADGWSSQADAIESIKGVLYRLRPGKKLAKGQPRGPRGSLEEAPHVC